MKPLFAKFSKACLLTLVALGLIAALVHSSEAAYEPDHCNACELCELYSTTQHFASAALPSLVAVLLVVLVVALPCSRGRIFFSHPRPVFHSSLDPPL
jgi:hypothetical protein